MKKLTLLLSASALAALLVVPSGASADVESARPGPAGGQNCDYARAEDGTVPAQQIVDNDPGAIVNSGAGGQQVIVYANDTPTTAPPASTGSGVSNDADAAAGVCVNRNDAAAPPGQRFDGGTLEAGVGQPVNAAPGVLPGGDEGPTGVYVVADGDDNNDIGPNQESQGYIGVSNFETGTKDGSCDNVPATDDGTGTNSGDCVTVRAGGVGVVSFPVPLLMCGNSSSGPPGDRRWENSTRDGCKVP